MRNSIEMDFLFLIDNTLLAMRPSLSSSANRRISSNNFSRCFLLALVQLSYNKKIDDYRMSCLRKSYSKTIE